MTFDLVRHASRNTWCNPKRDYQYLIKLHRTSPLGGRMINAEIYGEYKDLPDDFSRWHVFNVGHIIPEQMGIDVRNRIWFNPTWKCITESLNELNTHIEVHTNHGVWIPKIDCYTRWTENLGMVVAIRQHNFPYIKYNQDNEHFYLHLYSNVHQDSKYNVDLPLQYYHCCESRKPWTSALESGNRLLFEQHVRDLLINNRKIAIIVNGIKSRVSIDPHSNKVKFHGSVINNIVNFDVDSLILEVIEDTSFDNAVCALNVDDLEVFRSEVDIDTNHVNQSFPRRKYIFHPPKPDGVNDEKKFNLEHIYYYDDVEFSVERGGDEVSLFKSNKHVIRQLTNRDWSIDVLIVKDAMQKLQNINPGSKEPFRIFARARMAQNEDIVFEANKVHELYKLSDVDIVKALTGYNSTLDFWKASKLENSPYNKLISLDNEGDITEELVCEAYGYNYLQRLLGDSIQQTKSHKHLRSPEVMDTYVTTDKKYITLHEFDGQGDFISTQVKEPQNRSISASGQGFYEYVEGHAYWAGMPMVTEDTVMQGSKTPKFIDGVLQFRLDVNGFVPRYNNPIASDPEIELIPTKVRIFSTDIMQLSEGVDYVIDYPNVFIINEKIITAYTVPNTTKLTWFATRFKQKDTNPNYEDRVDVWDREDYPWLEMGFVYNGKVSRDNKYIPIEDRCYSVFVANKLYYESTRHLGPGAVEEKDAVFNDTHLNGAPYTIYDSGMDITRLNLPNIDRLKQEAKERDLAIAKYVNLDNKVPDEGLNYLNPINHRFGIVSPLLSALLNKMLIDPYPNMEVNVNLAISLIESDFKKYSDIDPISRRNKLEPHEFRMYDHPKMKDFSQYVTVLPYGDKRTYQINWYNYKILEKVIEVYTDLEVDLSNHITVTN